MKKGLYLSYFWANVNWEMLSDILDYNIEEISVYMLSMWKYFYELEKKTEKNKLNQKVWLLDKIHKNLLVK